MINAIRLRRVVAAGVLAISLVSLCATARAADAAQPTAPIELWPADAPAPGDKPGMPAEVNKSPNDPVVRLTNVSRPTITVFRPPADKANGAAVVVCPGGGYNIVAANKEGLEVCEWLNTLGVTAVQLKYRVPRREGRAKHEAPLQDVQRALGIVRHRATEWGIDPQRIGVMGFSAGGHLSACASTNYEKRTYPAVDDADAVSCRPDFAILIYPFYLTGEKNAVGTMTLAPELPVTDRTPPTFIVMTQDDRVDYAYAYALALKQAKVPAELHVYAAGGHGFGFGRDKGPVSAWPLRAAEWLEASGWMKK